MKGQGLSTNFLIAIVLALLVLIVLASIMSSRFGIFARETTDCKRQGGMCATQCGQGAAADKPIELSAICTEGEVCCTG